MLLLDTCCNLVKWLGWLPLVASKIKLKNNRKSLVLLALAFVAVVVVVVVVILALSYCGIEVRILIVYTVIKKK